jgi:ribulose-phosphate 3-epimerase
MSRSVARLKTPVIAPSILTADFGRLREQVREAELAGVEMIHLDVMDGWFVPNISFGPLIVQAVREATDLPLDVHLMIQDPERYIESFASSGADNITIHTEATSHVQRAIQQIRDQGASAGIAINPGTAVSEVEELLAFVDLVLIMTVNPGFGGQAFIPEMVDKIRRVRAMLTNSDYDSVRLEVDGGINRQTIGSARAAGAEFFVCGSSVFSDAEPVSEAVSALREALGPGP